MNDRHYAVTDLYPAKIQVLHDGVVLAESTEALILKEVGKSVYNPVFYFPKKDILMDKLTLNDAMSSSCPIKGTASYWEYEPAKPYNYFAWSYEQPLPRAKKIAEHLAFNTEIISLRIDPLKSS